MTWTPDPPETACLVLEDGTSFEGRAFGAPGSAVGEVCFNTAMCGYQEVLSDPSYAGQIVVMTAPQIGNYGISAFDDESRVPHVAGFVIRNLSRPSNWRSVESLHAYLERHGIPALCDVDTRALTRRLRDRGAQRGALGSAALGVEALQRDARSWSGLENCDLASVVTCSEPYHVADAGSGSGSDLRHATYAAAPSDDFDAGELHIAVYDFGVKTNILQRLIARGCKVTVLPATTPAAEALALQPHGILLSNGPGDPLAVGYAIECVRKLLGRLPLFGICLGHQILGLALGAKRFKLKFGHRGVNHPVYDRSTGLVRITSQNHGFGLDADSMRELDVEITEVSLNDGSVEGLRHRSLPALSVQYHPEAAPGPHENDVYFDRFLQLAARHAGHELPASMTPPSAPSGGEDAAA